MGINCEQPVNNPWITDGVGGYKSLGRSPVDRAPSLARNFAELNKGGYPWHWEKCHKALLLSGCVDFFICQKVGFKNEGKHQGNPDGIRSGELSC
jgi:hypothetical protein